MAIWKAKKEISAVYWSILLPRPSPSRIKAIKRRNSNSMQESLKNFNGKDSKYKQKVKEKGIKEKGWHGRGKSWES